VLGVPAVDQPDRGVVFRRRAIAELLPTPVCQRLFANAYLVVAMPPSTGMTAPVT
jgi:hypothetical protein